MWSKPLLCRFRQSGKIQQTQVLQGFAAFHNAQSRIPPRHSQTRRDTNFAIPGYSISAIISRRGVKIKFFLSVVIPVVKAAFMPLSATGGNPANAGVARLYGVSPCPVPDIATALPNHPRYQLRHTRIYHLLYHSLEDSSSPKKACRRFPWQHAFCDSFFIRIASESAPKSPHPPGRIHSLESPPGESRPWHDAPAAGAFPGRWCSDTGSGEW